MLTLLNKIKNSINGNFKPDPIAQCSLDSGYNIFLYDIIDRDLIESHFHSLKEFQKALNTIPKGRTFTINTLDRGEVKLLHGDNGFVKAD